MKYKFYYFFLLFFQKYNYLPVGLIFKPFHYTKDSFWQYFFGSFVHRGYKLRFFLTLLNSFFTIWLKFMTRRGEIFSYFNFKYMMGFLFKFNLYNFFCKYKFLFFYHYRRVNKKIYKFSRYKTGKFNLKLQYLPTYRRFRKLITFFVKMASRERGKLYLKQLYSLFFTFFVKKQNLFSLGYIHYLQKFIFLNYRKTLFKLSRHRK